MYLIFVIRYELDGDFFKWTTDEKDGDEVRGSVPMTR